MKALMIASMVMRCCAAGLLAAEVKATPPAPDALVIQYDPNGNGKIDVSERKPYVRERARRQREEAKRLAAVFKNVPPNVLRQVEPPGWTKAKLARYDLNQNGKIDVDEAILERQDALKAAEAKARQGCGKP